MLSEFQDYLMKHESLLEGFIPHVYGFLTEKKLEKDIKELSPKKAKIKITTSEVDKYHDLIIKYHGKNLKGRIILKVKLNQVCSLLHFP